MYDKITENYKNGFNSVKDPVLGTYIFEDIFYFFGEIKF